jgi:hypothetical protein
MTVALGRWVRRRPRLHSAVAFGIATGLVMHWAWIGTVATDGLAPVLTLTFGLVHALAGAIMGRRLLDGACRVRRVHEITRVLNPRGVAVIQLQPAQGIHRLLSAVGDDDLRLRAPDAAKLRQIPRERHWSHENSDVSAMPALNGRTSAGSRHAAFAARIRPRRDGDGVACRAFRVIVPPGSLATSGDTNVPPAGRTRCARRWTVSHSVWPRAHGSFASAVSAIVNVRAVGSLKRYGKSSFVVHLRSAANVISSRFYHPAIRVCCVRNGNDDTAYRRHAVRSGS